MGVSPLVILPATTFALGVWQVYRLNWKRGLVNRAEYALTTPATPWETVREFIFEKESGLFGNTASTGFLQGPKDAREAVTKLANSISPFRRIILHGNFLPIEILVGPRTRSSVAGREGAEGLGGPVEDGYLVISPFQLASSPPETLQNAVPAVDIRGVPEEQASIPRAGFAVRKEEQRRQELERVKAERNTTPAPKLVLVCRGWVRKKDRDNTATRQISGPVTLETMMAQSFALPKAYPVNTLSSLVIPANDKEKGVWYTLNVEEMTDYINNRLGQTEQVEPTLFEVIQPASGDTRDLNPLPKKATVNLTNNHLSYAITWYSILCTLYLYRARVRDPWATP